MKAKIEDLKGKYYGTIVSVEHEHGETEIKVWFMGDFYPSERELCGNSYEKWEEDGCGSDTHYESKDGYEIAKQICRALNDQP